MKNRYSFITRKSGKRASIKGVSTRQIAREIKAGLGFKVAIFDNVRQQVVR